MLSGRNLQRRNICSYRGRTLQRKRCLEGWRRGKTATVKGLALDGRWFSSSMEVLVSRKHRRKTPCGLSGAPPGWDGAQSQRFEESRTQERWLTKHSRTLAALKPAQVTVHKTIRMWGDFLQLHQPPGENGRRGGLLDSDRLEAFPNVFSGEKKVKGVEVYMHYQM